MNGIGGRTIEEAQQCLSHSEFLTWAAFRQKRGSLHIGMRVEYGFAALSSLYVNMHTKQGGYRATDFMPHMDEAAIPLDEAIESWI